MDSFLFFGASTVDDFRAIKSIHLTLGVRQLRVQRKFLVQLAAELLSFGWRADDVRTNHNDQFAARAVRILAAEEESDAWNFPNERNVRAIVARGIFDQTTDRQAQTIFTYNRYR